MNFELNDEQRMLADSLRRLLADRYDFEARRRFMETPNGFDRSTWTDFAELGLFALPFSEEDGGLGGTSVETMIVGEAMGHALVNEPWFVAMAIAPALLEAASREQRQETVEAIVEGSVLPAWAHLEPGMIDQGEPVTLQATEAGLLSGTKTVVHFGAEADLLFVTARGPDGGDALYLVTRDAEGLEARGYRTQDGRRAAEMTFESTPGQRLSGGIPVSEAISKAQARALAAIVAEALGAMEASIELTVEYLKTREQFGRPIGSFQALQHIAAGAVVEIEQFRSMSLYASVMCDDPDPKARDLALSAAKIKVCDAAREIGQMSIQLHGGVGMTMEYAIGHYFKRLTMLELAGGDRDFHMDRLTEAGGLAA